MSFSVRHDAAGIEWAGTNLATLFAQPANALRPAYWHMLADLVRFNRDTTRLHAADRVWSVSLGEYLAAEGYGAPFRDWYLLPMAAAIWSAPRREILEFPLPTFVRFCHNHGLLRIVDRPCWRTVRGGARTYVAAIARRLTDVRDGDAGHSRHAYGRGRRGRLPGTTQRAIRRGRPRVPQRPGAGAAGRPVSARTPAALGDPLPAESRAAPYRSRAAAAPAARLVGVELPGHRRRRGHAAGGRVVPDQQAAAAALARSRSSSR
jgi:hypothetical protein